MKRLLIVIIAVVMFCTGFTFDTQPNIYNVYCDKCGSSNIDIEVKWGECSYGKNNEPQAMSGYSENQVVARCAVYHGSTTILTCLDCGYKVENWG